MELQMSYTCRRAGLQTMLGGLVALALLSACGAQAAELSRAEAELAQAERQRFDAQIANDVAALKLALADELVYTHSSARVQNKEEYLRGIESGTTRYLGIDVPDRIVRVWDNTGVTHGTITLRVAADRKLVSRYTGVYIKRAGRWQLLAWQSTSVPDAR
jgi:hypothetical protein